MRSGSESKNETGIAKDQNKFFKDQMNDNIPTKKSFHRSGGIPAEFYWSHGKLLKNNWNKWNLWNSSEIPLEFQQFIILRPLKFHLSKIFVENWR